MKVAIDAQLAVGTATGIGEYVCGLIGALREQGLGVAELREPRLDPWRFDRRVLWDQVVLPRRARASRADLLHCASGTMPLRSSLPTVVTIHDVAWLKVQAHAPFYARYYFGAFALAQYRRAAVIAVDSEFSRNELLAVLNVPSERVRVVYPGVAADFCALARRYDGTNAVILVPGTIERRKNLEVLVRALLDLPAVRVVCVGPRTPYADECRILAESLGVDDRVEFRGYVARDELLQLYASCALVAVPSRYEGFGYAAAQALCAGVPLLVSDRSSLPEIVRRDARVIPVDDVDAWSTAVAGIVRARGEAEERAAAVRPSAIERFAWRASAARMRELYEGTLRSAV